MCIRDSYHALQSIDRSADRRRVLAGGRLGSSVMESMWYKDCLLYTSDAADERSSVDLGGRRIIKKKKNTNVR